MCWGILQLLGAIFHIYPSRQFCKSCCLNVLSPVLSVPERRVKSSYCDCRFVYFSLKFWQFLFLLYVFCTILLVVCKIRIVLSSRWVNIFIIVKYHTLFLIMLLSLKSTLYVIYSYMSFLWASVCIKCLSILLLLTILCHNFRLLLLYLLYKAHIFLKPV